MFHITCFAGTSGDMLPAGFTALTVFGGAELRRPTLASLLLYHKGQRNKKASRWENWFGRDENLVITVFGGTSLVAPTAAEEYAALTGVLRSGALSATECAQLLDALPELGARRAMCRTLTLFGACVTEHPSPKKERQSLEVARKTGSIRDDVGRELEAILESPPEARARLIGRVAMAHA